MIIGYPPHRQNPKYLQYNDMHNISLDNQWQITIYQYNIMWSLLAKAAPAKVEEKYLEFQKKRPHVKNQEVRKLLIQNHQLNKNYDRLLIGMKYLQSFICTGKHRKELKEYLNINISEWKADANSNEIYDLVKRIKQWLEQEDQELKKDFSKLKGFAESETEKEVEILKLSILDYQNIIKQNCEQINRSNKKQNELHKKVTEYQQLFKKLRAQLREISQYASQSIDTCYSLINSHRYEMDLEYDKFQKLTKAVMGRLQGSHRASLLEKQQILDDLKTGLNLMTVQSSEDIFCSINNKIQETNALKLSEIIARIRYGTKVNCQNVTENVEELEQQIINRYTSLNQAMTEMQLKFEEKSQRVDNVKKILQQPTLSFMWSHIFPILNSHDGESLAPVFKSQSQIISNIQKYFKKTKIVRFMKLIYSYKDLSRYFESLHQFIDGYPNLLMLIKLHNDAVIGAYSDAGLNQDSKASNKHIGFIFECINNRVYQKREKFNNMPIMPYNKYHIIVGNHDIKIYLSDRKVESSFGNETSMFRPNSEHGVKDLFNCSESECIFEDIEFYSVYF